MQGHRPVQLFSALMAVWLTASPAQADEPLRPPYDWTVCSPGGLVCAEMDVEAGRTTVLRQGEVLWHMPGWFRDAYIADDGDHFVTGYDGLNLLSDARPQTTMVTFWRRASIVRSLALSDILEDPPRLRRTVSHFLWGNTVGLDDRGRFLVHTVEDRMLVFDVSTGALVEVRREPYPL